MKGCISLGMRTLGLDKLLFLDLNLFLFYLFIYLIFYDKIMLWHHRLDHPSFPYLKSLFSYLFKNKDPCSFQCENFQIAKHTRVPFPIIHSDIWWPSRVTNISGTKWFITFIDDHTRLYWVYLLKEKSKTCKIFQTFYSIIKTQFQAQIQVLRTDNGQEYFYFILGGYLV